MLTKQQANEAWEDLSLRLSPEWVYMDGEATPREVKSTLNKIYHAAANLYRQGFKCPAEIAEWDEFEILDQFT